MDNRNISTWSSKKPPGYEAPQNSQQLIAEKVTQFTKVVEYLAGQMPKLAHLHINEAVLKHVLSEHWNESQTTESQTTESQTTESQTSSARDPFDINYKFSSKEPCILLTHAGLRYLLTTNQQGRAEKIQGKYHFKEGIREDVSSNWNWTGTESGVFSENGSLCSGVRTYVAKDQVSGGRNEVVKIVYNGDFDQSGIFIEGTQTKIFANESKKIGEGTFDASGLLIKGKLTHPDGMVERGQFNSAGRLTKGEKTHVSGFGEDGTFDEFGLLIQGKKYFLNEVVEDGDFDPNQVSVVDGHESYALIKGIRTDPSSHIIRAEGDYQKGILVKGERIFSDGSVEHGSYSMFNGEPMLLNGIRTSKESEGVATSNGQFIFIPELGRTELVKGSKIHTQEPGGVTTSDGKFEFIPALGRTELVEGSKTHANGNKQTGTWFFNRSLGVMTFEPPPFRVSQQALDEPEQLVSQLKHLANDVAKALSRDVTLRADVVRGLVELNMAYESVRDCNSAPEFEERVNTLRDSIGNVCSALRKQVHPDQGGNTELAQTMLPEIKKIKDNCGNVMSKLVRHAQA